ncbi:SDR family oxidoreductase [Polycladomyces subterraneus]|uniref:SDR family oxidoreductase n=1 Tax=Polycladomyces subterraneus TaxID=1016997 RepID=A0ABT8IL03_9BACL|nr:SDR family oxidoreductase [Polycladomyces subterraneus]MDN4593434.1 SDR family oxidoreductase [Polycladomyces subterraneus]
MNSLDLFRLEGKTAIVTGGGRGLGQHMAEGLAEAGAKVVLCSRNLEACQEVKEAIEAKGGEALALACDVTNPDEVERVVATTEEAFGSVDIVVNNSGTTWGAPPEEMPVDRFERVMDVNVKGTFLMTQAAGRRMIQRGTGGRIINIASVAGLVGGHPEYMQTVGYNASKGAVITMTKDLAVNWARHNIQVNAIAPGWFPSKMSRPLLDRHGERMLSHIPMARFGKPEDLKGVVVFLASPAAAYITGQVIVVDGGLTAW